ncbi:MAG: ABC transporter substrate-binding protein [Chloroflexi bacterium]|nr:ABC transporter substrate-binding protein [Chloroflexota bacterium]
MDRRSFPALSVLAVLAFLVSCAPAAPVSTSKPPPASPAAQPVSKGAQPTATSKVVDQPKYGGTLVIANKIEPRSFDMHQDTSIGMQLPLAPAYNMVVQNDPQDETKIIGDLAKSWEVSADGLTYTFRLHEGVKFHDGNPLRAEDVKFNLDRIIFPPQNFLSARKELFRPVARVEAPDALTAKVVLKYPQPSFLQLMAMPFNFIFSPEVVKRKGDMKRDVVGTGPFKFSSYVDRISFSVKKNPDYFVKGRPYLDGITMYVIFDEMTRLAALRTRQLNMLPLSGEVTPTEAVELKRRHPELIVHERANPGLTALVPNIRIKPWGDVRVRQAINLAVDREAAGKVVRGGYFPGYGYMLPGGPWSLPETELMSLPGFRQPKDADIAEARKLLAQAGYPEGFKTTMMANVQAHERETSQVAKDQLAKIGIVAEISVVDSAVAKDRKFEGKFDLLSVADASAADDPDILLGEYYLTGSPKNWGAWSSKKYDEIYAEQSRTMDARKRLELVWDLQRLLHQEAPRSIVTWSRRFGVLWPEVKDWVPGKSLYLNHKFQDVWLNK